MRSSGAPTDLALGYPTSYDAGDGSRPRYNTLGSLTPVWPRPVPGERTLGVLVTGQSVIGNWSIGTLYTASSPRSHQLNILDGRVYAMADPVFGADGTGGSPTSALGDALISSGRWDRVTVCNVAFGSTRSSQWADGTGTLARGAKIGWSFLQAHGYTNTVQIHGQGEGDAFDGVTQAAFLANLQSMTAWRRAAGITCPLYVSRSTFDSNWTTTDPSPLLWTPGSNAQAIRAAQLAIVDGISVFQGPDVDAIRGSGFRTSTHWNNQAGPIACAAAWAAVLP